MSRKKREARLIDALIPLLFLILFLTANVIFFDDTLGGANQMALLLSGAVAGLIAWYLGISWEDVRKSIVRSISAAMPSMLILLLIGSLAGTWLISGVVPAMIFYGLKILSPGIFLLASVIICALVSLATGSSWSTVATIGIALLGIGSTLGFSKGLVAGAIISGAYFGDKMSPLSDTTNLAPAMAGTDLFTHIRYMAQTTVPSITITLIIFFIIGLRYQTGDTVANVEGVMQTIEQRFNINPFLFIVPVLLIFIIIKKVPPLPSLLAGTLLGGLFAIIFQPEIIHEISHVSDNYAKASYIAVMQSMFGDVDITTSGSRINDLLSSSGMAGMLNTIWLILSAMIFGGIMESAGLLVRITKQVMKYVNSPGSLVASTAGTCMFFNVTASDQYIAIVVPGRMYSNSYKEKGLKPEVLSRTLEDSGTVTSVLIPWNTCGATQSTVLGVATLSYLPYAFFNIISPFMTIVFAYFNIKIRKITDKTPVKDDTPHKKFMVDD